MRTVPGACGPTGRTTTCSAPHCTHPDVALNARAAWARRVDLDTLDLGSLQLLPLLTARLDGVDTSTALEQQVNRVVRFSWLRTQLLSREVAPGVRALREAGLRPMLSKGAALVHAYGISAKLRPMFDIDVSVATADLETATRVLHATGFTSPLDATLRAHSAVMRQDMHAIDFARTPGVTLDLHWHLLHGMRNPELSDLVRRDAIDAQIATEPCLATGLEDTLLLTIAHGASWAPRATVRWVGDAALLLQAHGERLRWELFVQRARQSRLSRSVLDALDYLEDVAGIAAPQDTRRALARAPVPVATRLRRRRPDTSDGGPAPAGRLARYAEAYEQDVAARAAPGRGQGRSTSSGSCPARGV